MKIFLAICMFLLLGAFFIISNENLSLKESSNFDEFTDMYYDWLGSLFENGKELTGNVINSEWLPETS
jgi:hypothetical protein